ncbi:hypothetical protein C8F04DRAFT_1103449 [Mycena alexandri]|uniref:Uncharacterized protein n=1 Tax=Mycena alexandri TaxID=1745969 RepID=A0AAD6SU84_9AGAR|nr:hypothetical protein C8F04DRAFT_1103449 [Mycena alexandri]
MATNTAIVDDRDSLIHYSPAWGQSGTPEEFDATTSVGTAASAASFTFVGTSITVYATVPGDTLPRNLAFLVDNSISGTFNSPHPVNNTHHFAVWSSPTLSNATHTLVITQETSAGVFLDYFLYNTTSTSATYFIDDRDPRITYTPAWSQNNSEAYFQQTSQQSTSAGDAFSFSFEGTSISVHAPVTDTASNISFAMDGGPPLFHVPPQTGLNLVIYDSGDLAPGNHTLVVAAENDHSVWVDYFLVTPSSSSSTGPSPASSSTPKAKSSTPIGEIVGPVLGVFSVVALIAGAALILRRRRRQRQRRRELLGFDPFVAMQDVPARTPFSNSASTSSTELLTKSSRVAPSSSLSPAAYSDVPPPNYSENSGTS